MARTPRIPKNKPTQRAGSVSAKDLQALSPKAPYNYKNQCEELPITEQQRQFITFLVHDKMPQTAAARLAGYAQPGTAAHGLLLNPRVKKAIAVEREEYAKASGLTRKKVIDGFIEAIDMARIKADPIAMISGWREIGKMCGFYEPQKVDMTVSVSGQVLLKRLQTLSDEELLKMVESDPSVLEGEFEVSENEE